ncbi:hypothetical protein B5F40_05155 [Gordonibacter sp. An230]|uniref:hypothetical protein n=1 Tax=Gordonibacter sp. An230 TaxID=1965592 RepID=UPI000B36F81F|nr:hypothetical protein [Gordonibacter sp. An230]OUO90854.1 hypothetical protein B5F40_05155 [Gordonibacter sp. An230]
MLQQRGLFYRVSRERAILILKKNDECCALLPIFALRREPLLRKASSWSMERGCDHPPPMVVDAESSDAF